jgi:phage tail sheath gpL-like
MALTSIADRLTPSVPIEFTFGAQPIAPGKKYTTLFGHKAASGGSLAPYGVHDVVSLGDPDAAKAEVDALAGSGSEIGKMAYAFVAANSQAGRSNFPAFRVVLLAHDDTDFGAGDAAINAVKFKRSDMLVGPYPGEDSANLTKLKNLAVLISGPDRDLQGQFGSFVNVATLEAIGAATTAIAPNSRNIVCHILPDSGGTPANSIPVLNAATAGAMMASAFPYNPLQGVAIGGLVPPVSTADWIAVDPAGASEAALVAGFSPLRVMPGGLVGFIRTRTTYNLLPDAVTAATAYFDWQDLVVLNDFRESCYQITQNPPFNNNPGGTKASQQIAAKLKDEILREAQTFEDLGAFQAVKTLAPQFVVAPSTTSRGRFDFFIPVNVLPGLYVIAGNIQAVTTFDFTL